MSWATGTPGTFEDQWESVNLILPLFEIPSTPPPCQHWGMGILETEDRLCIGELERCSHNKDQLLVLPFHDTFDNLLTDTVPFDQQWIGARY